MGPSTKLLQSEDSQVSMELTLLDPISVKALPLLIKTWLSIEYEFWPEEKLAHIPPQSNLFITGYGSKLSREKRLKTY